MNAHELSDLDSLVFTVRDKASKRLITEAITSYRGGAFRSAIMSTWIAVAYDIITKARELAAQGESAPKVFISKLDQAIAGSHVNKLQEIESTLLTVANEQFQFFAPHEFSAFERLQKDRNLCAHPAFVVEDELFQPSPELTRAHIVHAIQYLLAHAPLQGKSAVARFDADLLSNSFPTLPVDIEQYIRSRYLDRGKDALVITLIKGLITAPFSSESDRYTGREHHLAHSLVAISRIKPGVYEDIMPAFVAEKIEHVSDDKLLGIIRFLAVDPRIWSWLSNATCLQVKTLLSKIGSEEAKKFDAFEGFAVPELASILINILKSWDYVTQVSIMSAYPKQEFVEQAIYLYSTVRSYRTAEECGQAVILVMAPYFSAEDIEKLLCIASENSQIYEARDTPNILAEVFDKTIYLLPIRPIRFQLPEFQAARRE